MKKRISLIIIVIVIALVLCIPIPLGPYDDGGTRTYNALLYKIVVWNNNTFIMDESGNAVYAIPRGKTSIYLFPNNLKSIDDLLEMELANK